MESLRKQAAELKDGWETVFESIKTGTTAVSPYLGSTTPQQINEVIEVVSLWLDRSKAPTGFAPGYHLGKALCITALSTALLSLRSLQKGEYAHLPNFLGALNQIVSSLHGMTIFTAKDEGIKMVGSMQGDLIQALAVLGTAQHELRGKLELLEQSQARSESMAATAENIVQLNSDALVSFEEIEQFNEDSKKALAEIESLKASAQSKEKEIAALVERELELEAGLEAQSAKLGDLQRKSEAQQKLIDALLPKGASVGLASAFGARVGQLENSKRVWMGIFILSVVCLTISAYKTFHDAASDTLFELVLRRLPFALPLIWLGWFSAIQFGNALRVQEDYAFKEATSKAFAGYKDHMEHMASVQLDEANSAMNLLAEKTIEILAREPLRIFKGSDNDASGFMGFFSGKRKSDDTTKAKAE